MTVKELLDNLEHLDLESEVWIDTAGGLLPVDGVYFVMDEATPTTIITYSDTHVPEDTIFN